MTDPARGPASAKLAPEASAAASGGSAESKVRQTARASSTTARAGGEEPAGGASREPYAESGAAGLRDVATVDLGLLPGWPIPLCDLPLRERKLPVESCVAGLSARRGSASGALSWADLVTCVERITELGVPATELRAIGREAVARGVEYAAPASRAAGPRGSTRAYAMLLEIRLAEIAPTVRASAKLRGLGGATITLTPQSGAGLPAAIFETAAGILEALPLTRGGPMAAVTLLHVDGGARLEVDFLRGASPIARLRDWIRGRLDAPRFAALLRQQETDIARADAALQRERTHMRMQAAALRERELFWAEVIDTLSEIVLVANSKRQLVEVGRTARRRWGLGTDVDTLSRRVDALETVAPADRELSGAAFAELLRGRVFPPSRVRGISLRGRVEWLISYARRVIGPDGEPFALVLSRPAEPPRSRRSSGAPGEVERRTHDLETAQAELRALIQRLIAAERLRATSRLAGTVGDAIKAPLLGLELTAKRLRAEDPGPNTRLDRVLGLCARIHGVVDRTLELAREEAIDLSLQQPSQILAELVEELEPLCAARNVSLRIVDDGPLPRVFADGTLLRTGLVAVAENAAQLSPAGSEVAIGARLNADARTVEFYVDDCGPGISEAVREKIFDAFFTTRDGGTGLGLAIAKLVALRHDGTIRIEPRAGGGTRASIEIPAAQADLAPSREDTPAP